MTIDQDRGSEIALDAREQAPQGAVVGLVQPFDAPDRVVDRDALAVDFLGVADHAGDGAEAARHPHRTGVGERGQAALEHARIELVGLAVDVDIAARKMRAHQRITAPDRADHQLVHEAVLGAPQGRDIEPRGGQECARIDASAVWRIEHDRPAPGGRLENLEGRIELVFRFGHGSGRISDVGWRSVARRPPF